MDAAEHRLWCGGEAVALTPKQFELLFYFIENPGRTTKKSELLDAVWADTFVEETTLARNVSWLRKTLGEYADGEVFIETVPKIGYRFTAQVNQIFEDEEAFIIEEQTVQRIRGEETFTFEIPKEKTNFLSRKLLSVSALSAFVVVALAAGVYAFYSGYFTGEAQNQGVSVKTSVTVKNITVDATRETVETGLKVRPGDAIKISAMGIHTHGTDQKWTFTGDETAKTAEDFVFRNAAPYSLIAWIGTETEKSNFFQVSKNSTIVANREGFLYLTINDRKPQYLNNRGGLNVDIRLFRTFGIYAEDDDFQAAWGNELVEIHKEDTLAITGRGNIAYWQGGELYDLDGSNHPTAGLLAPAINTRSLIGKIGSQSPFKIGRNFPPQTMKSSGWLFISINDQITGKPGAFKNNNGEIYVDIELARQPEPLKNPI